MLSEVKDQNCRLILENGISALNPGRRSGRKWGTGPVGADEGWDGAAGGAADIGQKGILSTEEEAE